jgi:hypothetical protein
VHCVPLTAGVGSVDQSRLIRDWVATLKTMPTAKVNDLMQWHAWGIKNTVPRNE